MFCYNSSISIVWRGKWSTVQVTYTEILCFLKKWICLRMELPWDLANYCESNSNVTFHFLTIISYIFLKNRKGKSKIRLNKGSKLDIFYLVKMKLLFSETIKETTDRWAWLCLNIIFPVSEHLKVISVLYFFLLSTIYFLFFFCCARLPLRIDAAGIHAHSPLSASGKKWSSIVSSYGNPRMITSND